MFKLNWLLCRNISDITRDSKYWGTAPALCPMALKYFKSTLQVVTSTLKFADICGKERNLRPTQSVWSWPRDFEEGHQVRHFQGKLLAFSLLSLIYDNDCEYQKFQTKKFKGWPETHWEEQEKNLMSVISVIIKTYIF